MKLEYRTTLPSGLIQITTLDERFYRKPDDNTDYPAITWIGGKFPKGPGYENWLKKVGEEAAEIMAAKGERGSKVHQAIEQLLRNKQQHGEGKVMMGDAFLDDDGNPVELTADEYWCLMTWWDWWKSEIVPLNPKILAVEESYYLGEGLAKLPVLTYAGTVDSRIEVDRLVVEGKGKNKTVEVVGRENHAYDWKTKPSLYDSDTIQVTGHSKFEECEGHRMFINQIGYRMNQRGWKVTEITPNETLLHTAFQIWCHLEGRKSPRQIEYPAEIVI